MSDTDATTTARKPRVYLFCHRIPGGPLEGDVVGYALAEDGRVLTNHVSSSADWSKRDLGLTSDRNRDIYERRYPDGYELEWIDEEALDTHPGYQAAYAENLCLAEEEASDE